MEVAVSEESDEDHMEDSKENVSFFHKDQDSAEFLLQV